MTDLCTASFIMLQILAASLRLSTRLLKRVDSAAAGTCQQARAAYLFFVADRSMTASNQLHNVVAV